LDIPTVIGGDHVEGGIAVPFAIKLSEKAELETMTDYDFIHNETGSGYHVEYLNTGSLSYDLTESRPPILGSHREARLVVSTINHEAGPHCRSQEQKM
jgi:hypothetical protein